MKVKFTRPERAYAAVPNAMLRDGSLSTDARFLLCLVMSYSENFEFSRGTLQAATGWGRDKLQRVSKELREAGWLTVEAIRDDKGQLHGSTWVIHDTPVQHIVSNDNTESLKTRFSADREPENPVTGEPVPGFSYTIRKPEDKKTIYKKGADAQPALFEEEETPKKTTVSRPFTDDWLPSDGCVATLKGKGFSEREISAMAEACRDHHISKGTKFKDHDAALRTWARREVPGKVRIFGATSGETSPVERVTSGPWKGAIKSIADRFMAKGKTPSEYWRWHEQQMADLERQRQGVAQ